LHRLKNKLGTAKQKVRYARRIELRILAKREETSVRKALNTTYKHFSQDVQTRIEA
jgi:hypothetical protein